MSRIPIATMAGLSFVAAYVVAAISLPDLTGRMDWWLEFVYWTVAGVAWVFPIRWLMLWSAHRR